jgi:uncharacterized membrane protein YoaT (DUF817 family)
MRMPQAIFEWHGQEYEHNLKSADWYWAVGIIATALVIAAVLFGNYLLAALVVIATVALALHAARHPPLHRFAIVDQGLMIDNDLHPYEHMHSFAVFEYIEGNRPPVLSIKTASWFSPHLVIPLNEVDADALYEHLLAHVDEGEHQHSLTDLVAAWLGF